jgi:hypothetical protein
MGMTFVLVGCAIVFAVVVCLFPRLIVQPAIRSELWRLRDRVFDSEIAGDLPCNDLSVAMLIGRMEAAIKASDELTPGRLAFAAYTRRRLSDSDRAKIESAFTADLSNLSPMELERYAAFDRQLGRIIVAAPFVGTWVGILILVLVSPFLLLAGLVYAVNDRAASRARTVMREQREVSEEFAWELSLTPPVSRRRGGRIDGLLGI